MAVTAGEPVRPAVAPIVIGKPEYVVLAGGETVLELVAEQRGPHVVVVARLVPRLREARVADAPELFRLLPSRLGDLERAVRFVGWHLGMTR